MTDRASITELINRRLAEDPTFREALLADPRGALSALTGTAVPPSVSITVHEESPADIHLVLPVAAPLSDEDLELVAGGWGHFSGPSGNCG